MQMNDEQRIPAPQEQVWSALNDPDVLRRCIPGCDSLQKVTPTEMIATVTLKVGPVKASFSGKVTLSDLDPPNGYRITGEGSGGVAGFAKGGAQVRLTAEAADATLLHYEVEAQIGGKLAQLGARLIDATAKKLASEFFERLRNEIAPPADEEPKSADGPARKSLLERGLGLFNSAAAKGERQAAPHADSESSSGG